MTTNESAMRGESAWWERCYWCTAITRFGHWRNSLHVTTEPPAGGFNAYNVS